MLERVGQESKIKCMAIDKLYRKFHGGASVLENYSGLPRSLELK